MFRTKKINHHGHIREVKNGNRRIDTKKNMVNYLPWGASQPDKPDKNKCVIQYRNEFWAEECSYKTQFFCQVKKHKLFTLRGVCKQLMSGAKQLKVDSEYVFLPKRVVEEKPTWIETKNTVILWNEAETSWKLCNIF